MCLLPKGLNTGVALMSLLCKMKKFKISLALAIAGLKGMSLSSSNIFVFIYVYVWVSVSVYVYMCVGARGGRQRASPGAALSSLCPALL